MKVFIISVGSLGDIYPLFEVAGLLKDKGHEVIFFMNDNYRQVINNAGFNFRSILTVEDAHGWHNHFVSSSLTDNLHEFAKYIVTKAGAEIYKQVIAEYKPGETLLIAVSGAILGCLNLSEKLHIPLITVYLAPYMIKSLYNPPRISTIDFVRYLPRKLASMIYSVLERRYVDRIVGTAFNMLRKQLDLPLVKCLHDYHYQQSNLILTLVPAWFGNRIDSVPAKLKFTGFPLAQSKASFSLPTDLQPLLMLPDGPLVFTFGT